MSRPHLFRDDDPNMLTDEALAQLRKDALAVAPTKEVLRWLFQHIDGLEAEIARLKLRPSGASPE
jgi:hypothetical protein